MRSKATWAEMAGRPTKYFLNLEKTNFNKKTILSLENERGEIINDEKQVLNETNRYYSELYKTPNQSALEMNAYLDPIKIPKISESTKVKCEQEITLDEQGKAVMSLSNNKACGVDGIPIDWYKVFWERLNTFFMIW